jgi:hypothetical protein
MTMYKYTVLLLYPDYLAEPYGQDTYLAHVVEENGFLAGREAQRIVAGIQRDNIVSAEDFHIRAVFAGHLDDLK